MTWREHRAAKSARQQANAVKGSSAQRAGKRDEQLVLAACAHYAPRWDPRWLRTLKADERALRARGPVPEPALLAPGEAWVTKAHEALRSVRQLRDGVHHAVYAEPTGVDFTGVLAGGRRIALELKGSSTPSLPLESRPGRAKVRPAQAIDLAATHVMGGVAGLLVRLRHKPRSRAAVNTWWWLSWPAWLAALAEARAAGAMSLSRQLCKTHGVRVGLLPNDAPDWLPAALEADRRSR